MKCIKPIMKRRKSLSIIQLLRNKYGGKWSYKGNGIWDHLGKGQVRCVASGFGFTGDDENCDPYLVYYPKHGIPKGVL